jgi:DNA-binding beta-propeller fold protein YncE
VILPARRAIDGGGGQAPFQTNGHAMSPRNLTLLALACTTLSTAPAMAASPYFPAGQTILPAMPEGDFDQLDADVAGNRLYVSGEDGAAMYVFDLKTGALLQSGGPVALPHKVALDKAHGRLFIADGDDGAVKVLDTGLRLIRRIPVGPKLDTGLIDPAHGLFYVSSRDPNAPDSASLITTIATDSLKITATYRVPAATLKGLVMDRAGHRLMVSMRDRNAIGVIHLNTGAVDVWSPQGLHKSVPLAYDAAHHALYAGSREPGRLDVLDGRDGHIRASLPATETADSMNFDAAHGLLYVSGDTGMSRYRIDRNGQVSLLETDPALVGKTSLLVPQLHRIYVMRPRKGDSPAALTIFELRS